MLIFSITFRCSKRENWQTRFSRTVFGIPVITSYGHLVAGGPFAGWVEAVHHVKGRRKRIFVRFIHQEGDVLHMVILR